MKKLFLSASAIALLAAAPALAQSNDSKVTQTGSGAIATVTQSGANSDSTVSQTGGGTVTVNQSGSVGSTSTVTTSADDRPPESTVSVKQTDDGSTGTATGQANIANVVQDNVNGFGETGTGSTVKVDQNKNAEGASNFASVQQGRNAVSGQVEVTQEGADNSAIYSAFTSTDNDAFIDQVGVNNSAIVSQNFQNGSAIADVNQTNTSGMAENKVTIEQASAGFSTNPAQFARGAEAYAVQDGSGNTSTIRQTGYSATNATANYASSTQIGDGNTSKIEQTGTDGTANVLQNGDGNTSTVLQGGSNNTATVSQYSDGNLSSVTQSGSNNTATVTQGS